MGPDADHCMPIQASEWAELLKPAHIMPTRFFATSLAAARCCTLFFANLYWQWYLPPLSTKLLGACWFENDVSYTGHAGLPLMPNAPILFGHP